MDFHLGTNGFGILYTVPHHWYGGASVGDINGDGITDLAATMHADLGTTGYNIVIFGQKTISNFPSSESAVDGRNGFILMVTSSIDVSDLPISFLVIET